MELIELIKAYAIASRKAEDHIGCLKSGVGIDQLLVYSEESYRYEEEIIQRSDEFFDWLVAKGNNELKVQVLPELGRSTLLPKLQERLVEALITWDPVENENLVITTLEILREYLLPDELKPTLLVLVRGWTDMQCCCTREFTASLFYTFSSFGDPTDYQRIILFLNQPDQAVTFWALECLCNLVHTYPTNPLTDDFLNSYLPYCISKCTKLTQTWEEAESRVFFTKYAELMSYHPEGKSWLLSWSVANPAEVEQTLKLKQLLRKLA